MRRRLMLMATLLVFLNFLLFVALVLPASASVPPDNDEAPWWDVSWNHRVRFRMYSGAYDRIDVPIERQISFTSLLDQQGVNGTFDENSVRVIEYTASSILLELPSQFEKASNYNASSSAVGTVIWIMNGTTQADTSRTYYVYFDILENGAKSPPMYAGVSYETSGDYVFLENEKVNVTIRYKNGVYMEELYLDKNKNGIFESNEEMIGADKPYSITVRVTDAEKTEHGWADPGFGIMDDEEATLTILKDGPVLTEIKLSDISLRNLNGEACNIIAEQVYGIYKLGATAYLKTTMYVNEELNVSYSYEYEFLGHQELYDRWYVDETSNGDFTYSTSGYDWFFSGVPTYGFLCSYNSSGDGGVAFIPDMSGYAGAAVGELRDFGPALRFGVAAGTWDAGKKIELENRLFVHIGDWSNAKREALSINNPLISVFKLLVHSVDSNNVDLAGAEVEVYDSLGAVVDVHLTNSSGWAIYDNIGSGNNTIRAFWMGSEVANKPVFVLSDTIVDPLECAVYSLTVSAFAAEGNEREGVSVGVYQSNGTRISYAETNLTGYVSFSQLPIGDYVIRTYYLGRMFGVAKSLYLDSNIVSGIYEATGLGPSRQVPYVTVYALLVVGIGVTVTLVIFRKGHQKAKLGLLLSILILVLFLIGAYVQSSEFFSSASSSGISAAFDDETGFLTVGDVIHIRWKDSDRNGELDDWSLYVITSEGTKLVKIDLRTSLTTPVGTYSLHEADMKNAYYLDMDTNSYELYKPFLQEPNFKNNIHYRYNLKLKFAFSKIGHWDVNLLCSFEQGKPCIQLRWEIVEKGEGTGGYSLYPRIVPIFSFDRAILPANYTDGKLSGWNQLNGPSRGNPWGVETRVSDFGGYVGNMHVNNDDLFLHSSKNYKTQTKIHASALFSRGSNWVHDITASPPYFQYEFWVDWDGKVAPSSDIKIEVWVPDVIDLTRSEASYSPDGSAWSKYNDWTLTEGNSGDLSFSSYKGSKHRLLIDFPAGVFMADDGIDDGVDYGDPRFGNDEYLVRLKVAYGNDGLTTYEFEDSYDSWYGLRNMNDAWMWLIESGQRSWTVGIVPTRRMEYLAFQADDKEGYHDISMGISETLIAGGKTSFCTNIVVLTSTGAASKDLDSDGIWNMFDNDSTRFFSQSALFASRESLGEVAYETHKFDETLNYHYRVIGKNGVMNDWNVTPIYTVCLPKDVSQHLESDDAVFRLERYEYYVYDVSQSNEIRWNEKMVNVQSNYQLYAIIGLIAIGVVLTIKCKNILKRYWLILVLFSVGLAVRFYFQSLSVTFMGTDASVYGNEAQNLLRYGKYQINFLGILAQWIKIGAFAPSVTRSLGGLGRMLYPSLIVSTFMLFGESFFAIKSVDVILGSLTTIPTFYLAKRLFDEKTAVIAALLVVLNPLLIYYSGVHASTNILPALFATSAICAMFGRSKRATVATGFFTLMLLFARFEHGVILGATILSYYLVFFKKDFWKQKNLYILLAMFLVGGYIIISGGRFFSTRLLGGGLGEVQAPTLWETLTNPNFIQVRLYRALYEWWYLLFQENPFIFISAILGLLMNIKQWRKLSPLYLFPAYAIFSFSLSTRRSAHVRFIVQYLPLLAVLSAAFVIKLSNTLSTKQSHHSKRRVLRLKNFLLVFVFLEIIFLSFFSRYLLIQTVTQHVASKFNDGEVYNWIRVNTSPKSIIMAYSPVYTYYTGRQTVQVPGPIGLVIPDLDMVVTLIKVYDVDYLIIDRAALRVPDMLSIAKDPLNPPSGFRLIYWADPFCTIASTLLIYDVRGLHT